MRASDLPAFCNAVMSLPNPVHRDYLLTILFTGLRRSEVEAPLSIWPSLPTWVTSGCAE